MTALSFSVDGVPLNTLAYDIDASLSRRSLGASRSADVVMPGVHGVQPGFATADTKDIALSMWVIGADENGYVPPDDTRLALFDANLDHLLALFGRRRPFWLTMTMGDGTSRKARGRVAQAIVPGEMDLQGSTPLARFTVVIELIESFWQDVNPVTHTQGFSANGTWWMTNFYGTTAPINDSVIVVTGPVTNPKITCPSTGSWVQYTGTVAGGESLTIDCASWTATKAGTNVITSLTYGGYGPQFATFEPEYNSSSKQWGVRLQGSGSGMSGSTTIAVTAARRYQ